METAALPGGEAPLPVMVSRVIPAGFRHGFTTRAGGVSRPPFDSLNLGASWGDAAEDVAENRRRLLRASGARALHVATQVHGARVVAVGAEDDPAATAAERADGLSTGAAGVALAVFVADCVPILLADPRTGACAAVHAGWRGTVAGVVAAAVAALGQRHGSRPEDLCAALGPAIGRCCFEVGPEVAAAFEEVLPGARGRGVVLERPGRRPHVDLRLAQRLQLELLGLAPAAVEATDACTRCDPAGRFFSYRRAPGRTGQHLAFIGRVPTGP